MSVAEDFNAIERQCKQVVPITQLEAKCCYPVKCAWRRHTKFGPKLCLEMADFLLLLPKRYNAITDESIAKICLSPWMYHFQYEMRGERIAIRMQANESIMNDLTDLVGEIKIE